MVICYHDYYGAACWRFADWEIQDSRHGEGTGRTVLDSWWQMDKDVSWWDKSVLS